MERRRGDWSPGWLGAPGAFCVGRARAAGQPVSPGLLVFVVGFFFFSTLTRYPRLFADVSSQFFSYGESHPHPHSCFLRNSILRDLGFHAQVSIRAPLFAFPSSHFSILKCLRPCWTSPSSQIYLAATSQGVFLATFILISLRLHLFPRWASTFDAASVC